MKGPWEPEMEIGKGGREAEREREWHFKEIPANTNKSPWSDICFLAPVSWFVLNETVESVLWPSVPINWTLMFLL